MLPRVAADPDRARPRQRVAAVGLLVIAIVAGCGSSGPSGSAAASARSGGGSPSPTPPASPPARSAAPGPSVDPSPAIDPARIDLEPVVAGLEAPVGLVASPTVAGRTFVLEQDGRILTLDGSTLRDRPFLDVSASIVALIPDYDERGLLGLAFHPGFATNGRLFVYRGVPTTGPGFDHANRLSEFRLDPKTPDRVDPQTERVILEFGQPQFNHSGGALGFGPDGFLYLGTGDGGGRGDADEGHSVQGNAQDLAKLNGKVLRLDVDGRAPYAIPPDNPFAGAGGTGGRPEIYAWGFRNPWRLSWEPDGGRRLLVSDVGYGRYEEIDAIVRGGNYGWRIREGRHCLDIDQPLVATDDCPSGGPGGEALIDPVVEYSHRQVGIAVVGGYVYRGAAVPALKGRYVFADLSKDWSGNVAIPRGSLLVADPVAADGAPWNWTRLAVAGKPFLGDFVSGMGEDADGELYVLVRSRLGPEGTTGQVLRIVPGG
jgi:glucose/arabinose dehydrogenase